MPYKGFWILLPAALLAFTVVPARANLITDPGFESCTMPGSGPPPGWAESSGNNFCEFDPHTGSWGNSFTGLTSTLSQTIATVTGDNYDFSFWLEGATFAPAEFTASFGSDEVFDLVNPGVLSYTLEDFTVTATGTSTTVSFAGGSNAGGWDLDDVSVTDQGPATPEPTSLVLLATGLVGIAWRFRRQRA